MRENQRYFLPGLPYRQNCKVYRAESTNHMPLQAHRGTSLLVGGVTVLAAMPGTLGELSRDVFWAPTAGMFLAARLGVGFTLKSHFAKNNNSGVDASPNSLHVVLPSDYDLDLPA